MSFQSPSVWWLTLLLVLPLIVWRWARARRRMGVAYSSVAPLTAAGSSWIVRTRWIVPALRLAALALLIICVARPRTMRERQRVFTEGIAIQLVVDRSGSMLAMDFQREGRRASRLEVVKSVVEEFVDGGEALPGRPNDLIGLISFATFADSVCPITLDHGHLVETLRSIAVAPTEEDRATALGDAIGLGVERLSGLERRADLGGFDAVKSRVMILLTDGESNAGDLDPRTAAEMAAALGIKIYTIGAGSEQARAPVPVLDPRTGRTSMQTAPVSIDEDTLRAIADRTGGAYFRATDGASLEAIYAKIDELERTRVEQKRLRDYTDLAVQGATVGKFRMPPLLPVVFVLLAVEVALGSTRWRVLR